MCRSPFVRSMAYLSRRSRPSPAEFRRVGFQRSCTSSLTLSWFPGILSTSDSSDDFPDYSHLFPDRTEPTFDGAPCWIDSFAAPTYFAAIHLCAGCVLVDMEGAGTLPGPSPVLDPRFPVPVVSEPDMQAWLVSLLGRNRDNHGSEGIAMWTGGRTIRESEARVTTTAVVTTTE
jgi:hypothetical protein